MAPAAFFYLVLSKYFFLFKFLQSSPPIFDMATMAMATMAQFPLVQREGVAQVAARILMAWRNGESADLNQELEYARCLAAQTQAIPARNPALWKWKKWKSCALRWNHSGKPTVNTPARFGYWNIWQRERPVKTVSL